MIELKVDFPVYPFGKESDDVEITVIMEGDHTEDEPSVIIEVQGNGVIPDGNYVFTSQQAIAMAINTGSLIGITNLDAIVRIGKEVTFMQIAYNSLRDMGNLM